MGVTFGKYGISLSFGEEPGNTNTEIKEDGQILVKAGKPFPYTWRQGIKPYEHEFWGTDFRREISINNDFSA